MSSRGMSGEGPTPGSRSMGIALLVILTAVHGSAEAQAPDRTPAPKAHVPGVASASAAERLDPQRTEWAALPILGGGSDIGFLFGATSIITHLGKGVKPYLWRLEAVASLSIKDGPRGTELVQRSFGARFELPRVAGSRYRFQVGSQYVRTVNDPYFGIGNAAGPPPGPFTTSNLQRYQFTREEYRIRGTLRFPMVGRLDGLLGLQLRGMQASPYERSKLEEDYAARNSDGTRQIFGEGLQGLAIPAFGLLYDTRDREVLTSRGMFEELSVRVAGVWPDTGATHGGIHLHLRHYVTLAWDIILAGRVAVDAMFGNPPVFELSQFQTTSPTNAIGGEDGVRGVPLGLYHGRLKVLGTVELRRMLFGVHPFGKSLRFGADAFFDAGRVFTDYTFKNPLDGKGPGVKFGVGGGLLVLYGEASLFRVEIAYSPDSYLANPGFPAAIYVADDVCF